MNCLVCGLPLTDPLSKSYGIGPICREKAIMANNLDEVLKHLPGQHSQASHSRRAVGGITGAQDALNASGNPKVYEGKLETDDRISFYRKGGRRKGYVVGRRRDGRYDVQGYDGKKYIVDPNRKRTNVKLEQAEVRGGNVPYKQDDRDWET